VSEIPETGKNRLRKNRHESCRSE